MTTLLQIIGRDVHAFLVELRDSSNHAITQLARRFAPHPNTIRNWKKKLQQSGKDNPLFAGPAWNKIHD